MIGLVDRALALNPSFARGWYVSGILSVFAANPTSRSSISRPRCALARATHGSALIWDRLRLFLHAPV